MTAKYTPTIEVVCTGNSGRSPVAELLFRNEFEDRVINAKVISSGTEVSTIPNYKSKMRIVSRGMERDMSSQLKPIFSGYDIDQILGIRSEHSSINGGDQTEILNRINSLLNPLYGRALETFHKEEVQYRSELLDELGIGEVKTRQDQTIPNIEVVAILPMGKSNLNKIKKIYGDSSWGEKLYNALNKYLKVNIQLDKKEKIIEIGSEIETLAIDMRKKNEDEDQKMIWADRAYEIQLQLK